MRVRLKPDATFSLPHPAVTVVFRLYPQTEPRTASYRAPEPPSNRFKSKSRAGTESDARCSPPSSMPERRRIDAERRAAGIADERVPVVERVDEQRLEVDVANRQRGGSSWPDLRSAIPEARTVEIDVLALLARVGRRSDEVRVGAAICADKRFVDQKTLPFGPGRTLIIFCRSSTVMPLRTTPASSWLSVWRPLVSRNGRPVWMRTIAGRRPATNHLIEEPVLDRDLPVLAEREVVGAVGLERVPQIVGGRSPVETLVAQRVVVLHAVGADNVSVGSGVPVGVVRRQADALAVALAELQLQRVVLRRGFVGRADASASPRRTDSPGRS